MLPRYKRLNLKKDFKRVASGKKIELKYATLFIKFGENPPSGGPKAGIALSGKYFKKAVDRNRARRLTSKALEEIYSRLPDNVNIVALPKQTILGVKSDEVFLELEEALGKEKII